MPREIIAARKERAAVVFETLNAAYPLSTCALDHNSPWQLLVATMMSAQTTDVKVNEATAELFHRWPTMEALAEADPTEVGGVINCIGLWRNKARNAVGLSQQLVADFGGEVPRSVDELVTLPGVGRKTATAVLGTAFDMSAGITVDTHMLRINRLLKLSIRTDPDKMASDLERLLPPSTWNHLTHLVIDHGRAVCVARRPRCGVCPVAKLCPSAFDAKSGYKVANDTTEPGSMKNLSWLSRR